jgi:hypothetical protein
VSQRLMTDAEGRKFHVFQEKGRVEKPDSQRNKFRPNVAAF